MKYSEAEKIFTGDLSLSNRYIEYEEHNKRPIEFDDRHFEKDGLRDKIMALVQQIYNWPLRYITALYVDTPAYYLRRASWAHHTGIGGLAEHSYEVAKIALDIYGSMSKDIEYLDKDLLIYGGLMHDVGKMMHMPDEPQINGYGAHQVVAANHIYHKATQSDLFTPKQIEQMVDTVLMHHQSFVNQFGECSFKTFEAYLIRIADKLSAGLDMTYRSIAKDAKANIQIYDLKLESSSFNERR